MHVTMVFKTLIMTTCLFCAFILEDLVHYAVGSYQVHYITNNVGNPRYMILNNRSVVGDMITQRLTGVNNSVIPCRCSCDRDETCLASTVLPDETCVFRAVVEQGAPLKMGTDYLTNWTDTTYRQGVNTYVKHIRGRNDVKLVKGSEGHIYFVTITRHWFTNCMHICPKHPGFKLAIGNTMSTLYDLKRFDGVWVDLKIKFDQSLQWGDGTTYQPTSNGIFQMVIDTAFANHFLVIDGTFNDKKDTDKYHCLCQSHQYDI